MSASRSATDFVPALGKKALTRFYDAALAATPREEPLRMRLIAQAGIRAGQRVLDLGCGTASLSILAKQLHPDATVVGLDIDPEILVLARAKAARLGARVELVEGSATAPPFAPRSFDRVLSMLVLHHLTTEDKRRALAGARELLVAGGELHLADWGKPRSRWAAIAFRLVRRFDGQAVTEANVRGALPELMREAGFSDVVEIGFEPTLYGTLAYYRAKVV